MNNTIILVLIIGIFSACTASKKGQLVETNGGTLDRKTTTAEVVLKRFDDGSTTVSYSSVYYESFILMLGDLPREAILEVQQTHHATAPDSMSFITYRVQQSELVEQSRIKLRGTNYHFIGNAKNLLEVTTSDVADGLPAHQLINLVEGSVICTYTQNLATLTLPINAMKRYAGFHSVNSQIPLSSDDASQGWTGVLTYAKPNATLAKLALKSYDSRLFEKIRQFPPDVFYIIERNGTEIRTADLELFPEAGQKPPTIPTDFVIEINFGKIRELENIRIPVVNDALQVPKLIDTRLALEPFPQSRQ